MNRVAEARTRAAVVVACIALAGCSGAGPVPSIAGALGPFYARDTEIPGPCTLDPAPRGTATVEVTSAGMDTLARRHALVSFFQVALGRPVRVVSRPDFCATDLARDLGSGRVDIAYVPAFVWVHGNLAGRTHPLAVARVEGRASHRAVLFAAGRAPIDSLGDLARAPDIRIALPQFVSLADRVFADVLVRQAGLDPAALHGEAGDIVNPDVLCRTVATDLRRIGVGVSSDPIEGPARQVAGCQHVPGVGAAGLKVVAATAAIPNDVLAVRADLPVRDRDAVLAAIRALEADEAGRRTLEATFRADGWADPGSVDYRTVEEARGLVWGR